MRRRRTEVTVELRKVSTGASFYLIFILVVPELFLNNWLPYLNEISIYLTGVVLPPACMSNVFDRT